MLSYRERKKRLLYGAVARIAEQHGVAGSTVSRVLKGTLPDVEIQSALCAYMAPRPSRAEAFGPAPRIVHNLRRRREAQSA